MYKDSHQYAILLRITREPNMTPLWINGLLYLADKLHLENYGRLISGDIYMKRGLVPEPIGVHRLINDSIAGRKSLVIHRVPSISYQDGILTALELYDATMMSISDLRVLDEVIAKHRDMPKAEFIESVRDDAWFSTQENHRINMQDIINTLPSADLLLDLHGFTTNKEEVK